MLNKTTLIAAAIVSLCLLSFIGYSDAFEISQFIPQSGSYKETLIDMECGSHNIYIETDTPFNTVTVSVTDASGNFICSQTENGDTTEQISTLIYIPYSYFSDASTSGVNYTISVVTWGWDGDDVLRKDTDSYTIKVYEPITIEYVGYGSGSSENMIAGETHYGYAQFGEPFLFVDWYVRGPGETGLGTLVNTDCGDGTSAISYFSHAFASGSTTGEEYEITAYAWPASSEDFSSDLGGFNWDSYTVTVWTPPEEVITTPDELTITDDIKIGDSYAFTVDATSSSSNYVIDEIEVFVDGVSIASQSFSGIGSASLNVTGSLSTAAGSSTTVTASIKGAILKGGIRFGALFIFDRIWTGILRGTVWGYCQCADDGDELDNKRSVAYTCTVESESGSQDEQQTDYRDNSTSVKWTVSTVTLTDEGTDWTTVHGKYSFPNDVPFGFDVTLWLKSDDLHDHGQCGQATQKLVCKYQEDTNIGKIGRTILRWIPRDWDRFQHNFNESPVTTYDPCDDPYPVEFDD